MSSLAAYAAMCAMLMFVAGTWLFLKRLRLCFGERSEGQVVGYVKRIRPHRAAKDMFMPRVRYASLQHGQREFQSRMGASPDKWPVGTRVPVAYLGSDPDAAGIATPARLWLAPIAMWLFSAGMAAVLLSVD